MSVQRLHVHQIIPSVSVSHTSGPTAPTFQSQTSCQSHYLQHLAQQTGALYACAVLLLQCRQVGPRLQVAVTALGRVAVASLRTDHQRRKLRSQ